MPKGFDEDAMRFIADHDQELETAKKWARNALTQEMSDGRCPLFALIERIIDERKENDPSADDEQMMKWLLASMAKIGVGHVMIQAEAEDEQDDLDE